MRTFNFYLQLGVLGIVAVLALLSFVSEDFLFFILMLQLGIGFYQYLLGLVLLSFERLRTIHLKIYQLCSTGLLVLIWYMVSSSNEPGWLMPLVVFGLPWLLALYFLYISYWYYKAERK